MAYPLRSELFDRLRAQLAFRYGHAWDSQYGVTDDEAERMLYAEWTTTLAGLDEADIERGLAADALRGDEWPISVPAFAALCRGIPSLAKVQHVMARMARDEAHVSAARSPFLRLVWSKLDVYQYRRATRAESVRLIAGAYELAREHVMRGRPLPAAAEAAIGAEKPSKPTPASPEVAARYLAEMGRIVGATEPEDAPQ